MTLSAKSWFPNGACQRINVPCVCGSVAKGTSLRARLTVSLGQWLPRHQAKGIAVLGGPLLRPRRHEMKHIIFAVFLLVVAPFLPFGPTSTVIAAEKAEPLDLNTATAE